MEGWSTFNEISVDVKNKIKRMSLYNGARLPEYIFTKEKLNLLFFEFNICFSDEFIAAFAKYLRNIKVAKITISNIKPNEIVFNRIIETENLPHKFMDVVKATLMQDYIDAPVSFYMITELAEIYPSESNNLFCLILDRSFDIAIMATSEALYCEIFDDYKIKDLQEYLSASMLNNYSKDFDTKLRENYFN